MILVSLRVFLGKLILSVGSFSDFLSGGGSPQITCCLFSSLQDKDSMIQVLRAVDKANGYCFGDLEERNLQAMMSAAVGADFQFGLYPFIVTAVTHRGFSFELLWLLHRTFCKSINLCSKKRNI